MTRTWHLAASIVAALVSVLPLRADQAVDPLPLVE